MRPACSNTAAVFFWLQTDFCFCVLSESNARAELLEHLGFHPEEISRAVTEFSEDASDAMASMSLEEKSKGAGMVGFFNPIGELRFFFKCETHAAEFSHQRLKRLFSKLSWLVTLKPR